MKNIHGKLTPEKVDETMYVNPVALLLLVQLLTLGELGSGSGNRTRSAKRLSLRSLRMRSGTRWTRTSWMPSWRNCSRSSWTSRCCARATCPCRTRCTRCLRWRTARVSPLLTRCLTPRNYGHRTNGGHSQSEAGRGGGRRGSGTQEAAGRDGDVIRLRISYTSAWKNGASRWDMGRMSQRLAMDRFHVCFWLSSPIPWQPSVLSGSTAVYSPDC